MMTTNMLRRIQRLEASLRSRNLHVVMLIDDGETDIAAEEARHIAEHGPDVSFIIMRIADVPSQGAMQ